jgi:hypothetical protein
MTLSKNYQNIAISNFMTSLMSMGMDTMCMCCCACCIHEMLPPENKLSHK